MMRQYELVERVQKYKPDVNEALLNKAYVYAMQKHGQQKRASGDPYISHPLEVAAILTEMRLDESTIAVALLHDTIEDTTATRQEIDDLFGEDIGALVEGLTKIKKLDLVTKKAKQAENLRKLLLAISDDVRVLLVKLADRLHNMRTLDHMSAEKRARISEETMDIYAPLAGRMGMQDMREELENLSFRHINPEAFETVTRRLEELSERNEGLIKKIEDELRELLQAEGLKAAQVKGRQKKPYSAFRKMQSKSLSFEQLSDVWGFRIIVDDIPSCYRALGIVHTRWRVVPGRFKDYISTPKQNDYQSIHTTIVGPSRQRIELQIRTRRMNDIAEYGIAAHSLYKDREGKEGASADAALSPTSNAYSWLRRTIESLAEGDNPEEFLEHTKLELFQDQVFCFTPKGQLIALPRGATPIDFAYAVHTNIGDTCVGAKINGRIMPLVTRLNNGDEVEIIRSGIQVPPPAWEEIVVTGKARSAIRRATRAAIRKQYAGLGYRILERTFERAGKSFSREALKPALHRLGQKEVEDAIASVGRGELSSLDVLRAVFPDHQDERVTVKPSADDGWFNMRSAAGMVFKLPGRGKDANGVAQVEGPEALPIRGLSGNAEVHFSPAGAIPGDRIVGIMEKDKGITIYPIQSPILQKFDDEPERWIDVRWDLDEANSSRFIARIAISALNEPGTLAEVAQAIATSDVNIRTLSMGRVAADFSELQFDLEVWDLRQLNHLITQLKELPSVSMVKRLFE